MEAASTTTTASTAQPATQGNTDEEEEKEKIAVTAESYGALDSNNHTEDCWLLRVPASLAHVWAQASPGTDLGEFVFAPAQKRMQIIVSETVVDPQQKQQEDQPQHLPLEYNIAALTKKVPTMFPFVRHENGSCTIQGRVSRTANLQVVQNQERYRKLKQHRLIVSATQKSRFTRLTQAEESSMTAQTTSGFGTAVLRHGQRALAAQAAMRDDDHDDHDRPNKRNRPFAPDQPVRSVLFALFGRQAFWSVKDLKAAAVAGGASHCAGKVAEAEMRQILADIGINHRSGEHKNTWELKQEYRSQVG